MPRLNKYIQQDPTAKQRAFLYLDDLDIFFGGSAGPGKSSGLLMAALQYVDIPGYNALIIRNTYANLTKPDALIPRSFEWLNNTDAKWKAETHSWEFPSGSTLSFGYLDGPNDHFNYQGPSYQFIGIDEVVQIRENQALYLFSRLRRLEKYKHIPIRFRCASNPPAPEQIVRGSWVKKRYIDPETREDRLFIPAKIADNPYLDEEEYNKALDVLDPITRKQLKEGDWEIRVKGRMFDRSWFKIVNQAPKEARRVRYWDMASTEVSKKNKDPDWTAGCKLALTNDGIFYIEDIKHFRKKPLDTENLIKQTAQLDGKGTKIYIEQEPGSSGKIVIDNFIRKILLGFSVKGDKPTGSKIKRAEPVSSMAEAGNIHLINGSWIPAFLKEIEIFPDGVHDDFCDCLSGAFSKLTDIPKARISIF